MLGLNPAASKFPAVAMPARPRPMARTSGLTRRYCMGFSPKELLRCIRLPNFHDLRSRAHHRVAGLAGEGVREREYVGERAVGTEFRRCVFVGLNLQAQLRGTLRGAPGLRVGMEEALVRRQSIN